MDIKKRIEQLTGVPAKLLTAEEPDEIIAQADALLAFKRGASEYPVIADGGEVTGMPDGRSTRDQFADYFLQTIGN